LSKMSYLYKCGTRHDSSMWFITRCWWARRFLLDLKPSYQWFWRVLLCGVWCHVVCYEFSNIPLKQRYTFTRLQCITSKKTVHFKFVSVM
jgi:hypothetical protein